MNKESFHVGVIFTLLSATALALSGLFGKLGGEELTLSALVFWRFFSAFVLCLTLFALLGYLKGGIAASHFKMNFVRAFFTLGAQGGFYYYIQSNTLLNGMVLLSTGPLFIPLIEWAILRRHIGKSTWISLIISFIGVVCVLQPDAGIITAASLIGLLAGLCQGISQTLFGMTSHEKNPEIGVLVLFFYCALISLVPYLLFGATWQTGKGLGSWAIILILTLGVVSVLNQWTRSAAYQRSTPSRLSPFLYFSVPLAGLFDWWIFGRMPNLLSLIGMILVIGGGLLKIYLRKHILSKK
jgi:drug/metabolite transporter (DMT)-like permease